MWTNTPEGQQLIKDLASDLVSSAAPEELDLFDELLNEYFADPTPPNLDESASDDALGFGLGAVIVAATPAAAAMASAVVGFLLNEVFDIAAERSVVPLLRKLFNKDSESSPEHILPALSDIQLKKVKALALEQAQIYGMGESEAAQMANALVGAIVTTS